VSAKELAAMAERQVELERRVEALEQVNRDLTSVKAVDQRKEYLSALVDLDAISEEHFGPGLKESIHESFRVLVAAVPGFSECPDCCDLIKGALADHRPVCPNQKVS
jgi:hypothetical protein